MSGADRSCSSVPRSYIMAAMREDSAAPGSLEALRERNRTLVLAALRRAGAVSRAELARRTGLSRSTISTVVADLVAAGIAAESGEVTPDGVGRPGVPVTLNAAAGAAVGIAIAPARAAFVVADLGHSVLAEEELEPAEPFTVAG